MTEPRVRASAEALPNSRRAVLRSTLGAGAALGLICAALDGARAQSMPAGVASPDHPDADLFALQPEIEEMDRIKKTVSDLQDAEEEAYRAALPPKPVRPPDQPLWSILGFASDAEYEEHFERRCAEMASQPKRPVDPHDAAVSAWEAERDRLKG